MLQGVWDGRQGEAINNSIIKEFMDLKLKQKNFIISSNLSISLQLDKTFIQFGDSIELDCVSLGGLV